MRNIPIYHYEISIIATDRFDELMHSYELKEISPCNPEQESTVYTRIQFQFSFEKIFGNPILLGNVNEFRYICSSF